MALIERHRAQPSLEPNGKANGLGADAVDGGSKALLSEVKSRYALTLGALIAIQLVVGYEWLISGLSKLVRGGFASGLADELTEKSGDMYGWYWSFLDWAVIPYATAWGYLIEIGEVAIAVALVGSAIAWFAAGQRLSERARIWLLSLTALAAFAGLVLNVVLHLANGSSHPWVLAEDPFDEGVDLDMFMVLLELVIIVASVMRLRALRRAGSVLASPRAKAARTDETA